MYIFYDHDHVIVEKNDSDFEFQFDFDERGVFVPVRTLFRGSLSINCSWSLTNCPKTLS